MVTTLAVFVLLLGLALIGAALAQVVNYADWQFWGTLPVGTTTAGQVQRFFLKGLAPLFGGLVAIVLAVSLFRGQNRVKSALSLLTEKTEALTGEE